MEAMKFEEEEVCVEKATTSASAGIYIINYVVSVCPSVRPSVRLSWFRNANNSTTVGARRAKFGTQVGCWLPVIVLEFQPAVSNGERVARESLKFFGLRRRPSMLHVF